METDRFTFSFNELMPSVSMLELTMGYRAGEAPEPVTILLREVIEEVSGLREVKAEYRVFDNISLDKTEKYLAVEGTRFNTKGIIFSQISRAENIILFICTAGKSIGEKSGQCMRSDDLLRGYLYDVVGSEIVEAAAGRMQEDLKKKMATSGKKISNRFSPGYCGWDVSEQHELFSFFPDNFCGITLTESALMQPVKSVSGIIAAGVDIKFAPYQCKICGDKNCIYRNRKLNAEV